MPYAGKSTANAGKQRWGWKDVGGKKYVESEPWKPTFDENERKARQAQTYGVVRNAEYYKTRVAERKLKKQAEETKDSQ
jgi:heat shock protein HspQ